MAFDAYASVSDLDEDVGNGEYYADWWDWGINLNVNLPLNRSFKYKFKFTN